LLDAAGRLVAIMKDHGLIDPFLEQLQQAIDAERFGNSADEELRAALNELSRQYAQELRNRLSTTEVQN
jgi:hypothetical protein